jgi:hypothetical protein
VTRALVFGAVVGLGAAGIALGWSAERPVAAQPQATAPMPPTLFLMTGVCVFTDTALRNPRTGGSVVALSRATPPVPCPMIAYNPVALRLFPRPVAVYILLHEYSHVLLGHGLVTSPEQVRQAERDADCGAAKLLQSQWPEFVESVAAWIAVHAEADAEHDAGPEVAARLRRCAAGGLP